MAESELVPSAARPFRPALVVLLIFLGGVGGGLARYGITAAWPTPDTRFPWATLAVNTSGAFALAVLLILIPTSQFARYVQLLIGTGFLGAFTTFASVVDSVRQLAANDRLWTAGSYLAATVAAGLVAGWSGLLIGRTLLDRRGLRAPDFR